MIELSLYTHIFSREDRYFLYNSQHNLFAEIPKDLYKILYNHDFGKLQQEDLEDFCNKGILTDNSKKYLFYHESHIKFNASSYNTSELRLIIVPTTGCNFDCPYCFEGQKTHKTITPKIEDDLIEFINSHKLAKKLHITWYGGEPLLAFHQIKSIYNKIKAKTTLKITSHHIITNGSLINDEIIKFFDDTNLSHIQITLDGEEHTHNKSRHLKNTHEPTFQTILHNIQRLLDVLTKCDICIRVNIDKSNIDDFINIYTDVCTRFPNKNLTIYPGFIRTDTDDGCALCYDVLDNDGIFKFFKHANQNNVNVNFMPRKVNSKGCMANHINSYIIGPSGEIYKCWNDVNHSDKIIGYINEREFSNRNLFCQYQSEANPFRDDKCKNCLQFPICSGGCGWYRLRNLMNGGRFDLCTIVKSYNCLEESLLLTLQQNNSPFNKIVHIP